MIDLLSHLLSSTLPTGLDRESLSIIESCSKVENKMNECITSFNLLENKTNEDYNKFTNDVKNYKTEILNEFSKFKTDNESFKNMFTDMVNNLEKFNTSYELIMQQSKYVEDVAAKNIEIIASGENATKSDINKINTALDKILTFNIFPDDTTLNNMKVGQTFECKGFYEVGDIEKCLYIKVNSEKAANCIMKEGYGIRPITYCDNCLYLPFVGIMQGKENSERNTTIFKSLKFDFGTTLKFPSGHYYFNEGLNIAIDQLSLLGNNMSFSLDLLTTGLTWLHFENLNDGEYAIKIVTGSISNIIIDGGESNYKYYVNREKTYTEPTKIEEETYSKKCYGIMKGATTSITNVYVKNFYYGAYMDTGNLYINNFFARECHIGLSIGNDTKVKGVYGWDCNTLLQMRGSISSVHQVRCDSCYHLVNIIGYTTEIYLNDLDGDYCIGSLIKFGEYGEWGSTQDICINGLGGRSCAIKSYKKGVDEPPTSYNITDEKEVKNWGIISVEKYHSLKNCNITMKKEFNKPSNPMDNDERLYRTPSIILACASSTEVNNIIINGNFNGEVTKQLILNSIKSFSGNANNLDVALITSKGNYYYNRPNATDINITKSVNEVM